MRTRLTDATCNAVSQQLVMPAGWGILGMAFAQGCMEATNVLYCAVSGSAAANLGEWGC